MIFRFQHVHRCLAALLFAGVPAFAANSECERAYAEAARYAERVGDAGTRYAEGARQDLLKSSDELASRLERATREGHLEKVHLVVIGGGPHAAEIYSSYHATNPRLKAVVFERTGELGTFDRLGSTFSLNSRESELGSGNPIYGSSVKLSAFNPEKLTYVPAERMGDATVVAHYAARTPLAFHQEVTKVLERPEGAEWPARYLVKTGQGISVYADVIAAAPGMGTLAIRVKDAASLSFLASEAEKALAAEHQGQTYVPLVETLDATLARARQLTRANKNFLDLYRDGERVAVVGSGTGTMISVEALTGVSPDRIYPNMASAPRARVTVVWVGQTATNFPEFKAANSNERYWPTLEKAYAGGHVLAQPGRVVGWRATTAEEAALGKVALILEGQAKPVYVDRVVTGMGYDNLATGIFHSLVPPSVPPAARVSALERVLVNGELDQAFTKARSGPVPISQQLRVAGRDENIFFAGQATGFSQGKEMPAEVWTSAKGGFLDMIGRRSEALGRDLALKAGNAGFQPVVLRAIGDKAAGESLSLGKIAALPGGAVAREPLSLGSLSPMPSDSFKAELDLRVALQRELYPVRLPSPEGLMLRITGGVEHPSLDADGLDSESLGEVKGLIESSAELRAALGEYLRGHDSVALSVRAKADGRPIFESMEIGAVK